VTAPLIAALADAVGADHVLTDPEVRAGHERDWTGRFTGSAAAIARPASTAEVVAVVRACARHGAVVVPQGGNTGLVGGGVPRDPGASVLAGRPQVVLGTARLDGAPEVDGLTAELSAGAGVTLAAAQGAARRAGLDLALDLAARDSATLGGLAACDAGGLRALRHGTARRQIAGVEAVLADGTVIRSRMAGLLKDTAGLDLGALLVGSEGTLGVITAVRWSLTAPRGARAVALVGLDSVAEAAALAARVRPGLATLEVCELMESPGLQLTARHLGIADPTGGAAAALLLEVAEPAPAPGAPERADPLVALAAVLERAGADERAVTAADAAGRARLFALREAHAEAIAAEGIPVKLDVGVPPARIAGFRRRLDPAIEAAAPGARTIVFGHLADGNLHVNVLLDDPAPATVTALEDAVLELAAACGGTVSAEHGIGVHKPRHLRLVRAPGELAAMRAVKRALDPTGLLNPGVGLAPE
jgi:FAD/FMN-containing dehydrogenase